MSTEPSQGSSRLSALPPGDDSDEGSENEGTTENTPSGGSGNGAQKSPGAKKPVVVEFVTERNESEFPEAMEPGKGMT